MTLFVQPRDPAREVWTGTRLGAEGMTRATGIPARTIDQLRPALDSLLAHRRHALRGRRSPGDGLRDAR